MLVCLYDAVTPLKLEMNLSKSQLEESTHHKKSVDIQDLCQIQAVIMKFFYLVYFIVTPLHFFLLLSHLLIV